MCGYLEKNVDDDPSENQRCPNAAHGSIEKEQDIVLLVVMAYTIVHPIGMMLHPQYTPSPYNKRGTNCKGGVRGEVTSCKYCNGALEAVYRNRSMYSSATCGVLAVVVSVLPLHCLLADPRPLLPFLYSSPVLEPYPIDLRLSMRIGEARAGIRSAPYFFLSLFSPLYLLYLLYLLSSLLSTLSRSQTLLYHQPLPIASISIVPQLFTLTECAHTQL